LGNKGSKHSGCSGIISGVSSSSAKTFSRICKIGRQSSIGISAVAHASA